MLPVCHSNSAGSTFPNGLNSRGSARICHLNVALFSGNGAGMPYKKAHRTVLQVSHNCWRQEKARRVAIAIDGDAYFRAVREAIMAERRIDAIHCPARSTTGSQATRTPAFQVFEGERQLSGANQTFPHTPESHW
jgi:hypothetical protein